MAEIPPSPFWDAGTMQAPLSPSEMDLRDRFAKQYILDYDPVAAAMRLGYMRRAAIAFAYQFLDEAYVQQKIKELQLADPQNKKQEEKHKKREVEAGLWKAANYNGPGASHAARVTALSQLSKLLDMEPAAKTKVDVTHKGGVMMVPAIANLEDWEKAAVDSQSRLIADARH